MDKKEEVKVCGIIMPISSVRSDVQKIIGAEVLEILSDAINNANY